MTVTEMGEIPRDFPEMLEILAEWSDLTDRLIEVVAAMRGEPTFVSGDGVQRELRILARKVRDFPDVVTLMTDLMLEARDEAEASTE